MPAFPIRLVAGFVLAAAPLAAAPLAAMAGDWTAWRGPAGTGVSTEKNLPTTWSNTDNVKWKVALDGHGNSTPIVVGKRVLITHMPAGSSARGLRCYDRQTGELVWKHEVQYAEKEPTHNTNPPCAGSPVSDGERVVAWYGSAGLFCYDLAGNVLWQKDLGKVEHIWGYGSSPLIHEGLVILNFGPGLNAFVAAFDKKTGDEVWRKEYPKQRVIKAEDNEQTDFFVGSWSTPVVHEVDGRAVLLLSLPEKLRAVDPKTGDDVWTCDGASKLFYTSPLVAGHIVITMCGYGGPAFAVRPMGEGDQTANRLWIEPRNPQRVGSGVVAGDYVYILNEPGQAWCLDPKTGQKKWEERLDGGNSWSSMSYADSRLYILNTAGTTFVLAPSPEKCEILAENKLGELTRGSHAFSDGQIFIRTYQNLYCIEAKAGN